MTANDLLSKDRFSPLYYSIFSSAQSYRLRGKNGRKTSYVLSSRRVQQVTYSLRGHDSWARNSTLKIIKWLTDIGFADDCVICAKNPVDLQSMLDILNPIITSFGQEISVPKTKIIDICTSTTADLISKSEQPLVSVSIEGQEVKVEN